ncbi:diaminopimelate epimerase [Aquabacterium sp. A7-Y]|uniref:diaminopimelate epimerase n=1 Tax=Aquabacterium sp. A7-Y TaxID=1349605 RepID=UPI00223CFF43|nr:diaminopimelate epimerase [Aquabacterium sp. A7-Y]MCW7539069.1 diaminopimelate epimerase [Aquabacterium sp. A7-Y]
MKLRFTKMQGAGNDFVVLDATRQALDLGPEDYRRLADRRFGVGADQILIVGPSGDPDIDFSYRIVNADGSEVEQCGNGARCFAKFVRDRGLSDKSAIRVRTQSGVIEPRLQADGRVTVDMGAPVFEPERVPFDPAGLTPRDIGAGQQWPLALEGETVWVAIASMGNPHAVLRVEDVDSAPVQALGPQIERHVRFPRRVNAGFLQVLSRGQVKLRVYERGAGETLACGTGACAAVVTGIRLGWLDASVEVETRGGLLRIEWQGGDHPVMMTGPAVTVFEGEIEL